MFRTNVRIPQPRTAGAHCQISPVGSCEGATAGSCGAAANFGRPGAADGSCEGAAPVRWKGAATLFRAGPPENLTFKIKFLWSCVVVKIWKILSNFQRVSHKLHRRSAASSHKSKFEKAVNFHYNIYRKWERKEVRNTSVHSPSNSAFAQESETNNLKSSENLAIIYIESEREK